MAAGNSMQSGSIFNTLASLELGNERSLLDQIDQLRRSGVDEFVNLPQVVAVGAQSAGKSSVLEAISGLDFPRSESKCTRFAVEIRLRRSKEEKRSIRIVPAKDRSEKHRARIAKFNAMVDTNCDFPNLMGLAFEAMDIKDNSGRFSSKDILRVEKSGPTQSHLTIVDLPGLIQTSSLSQSQEDVDDIKAISEHYMKNPRTIILAIVSAAYDFANQSVIQLARKHDPIGVRTIGVITKPDKAEGSRLDEYVDLAKNRPIKLNLGWHVVRNRTLNEPHFTAKQRRQAELQFFTNEKWRSLRKTDVGVDSLRLKLSHQQQRHFRNEIPKVQKEIAQELEECNRELENLGQGKDTEEQMRVELQRLCGESSKLIDLAVEGNYKDPNFFPRAAIGENTPIERLRVCVVEQNSQFAHDIRHFGRKIDLTDDADAKNTNGNKESLARRSMTRYEYLQEEVRSLMTQSTGQELEGDINPLIVYELFQDYSTDWSIFAHAHKTEVEKLCDQFLTKVVDYIWPEYMRGNLRLVLLDPHINRLVVDATEEAKRIYKDRERYVRSYDPDFLEQIKTWTVESRLEDLDEQGLVAAQLMHKMLIFYDLTSKTFISNIIVQVIERHLLAKLNTIFDRAKVASLTKAEVEQIAAEDDSVRETRRVLRDKQASLEEGFRICRKIVANSNSGPLYRASQLTSPETHTPPRTSIGASLSDEETETLYQQPSRGAPRPLTPIKQENPPQEPEQRHIDQISTNDRISVPPAWHQTLTSSNPITPDRQAYNAYDLPSTAYQNYYRPSVQSPIQSPMQSPIQSPMQSPMQSPIQARVQSPPIVNREVPHIQQYNPPRVPDQYSYTPISEPLNDAGKQSRRKIVNGRNG